MRRGHITSPAAEDWDSHWTEEHSLPHSLSPHIHFLSLWESTIEPRLLINRCSLPIHPVTNLQQRSCITLHSKSASKSELRFCLRSRGRELQSLSLKASIYSCEAANQLASTKLTLSMPNESENWNRSQKRDFMSQNKTTIYYYI